MLLWLADTGQMAGEQRMNLDVWVCVKFWGAPRDSVITENKHWNQVVTADEFTPLYLDVLA